MASELQTPLNVVYLDYDGVLHHEAVYLSQKLGIHIDQKVAPGAVLFEWAYVLVDALRPYPEMKIVLSTSWCRQRGFTRAKRRLPSELQDRVIGGTYHRGIHGADHWSRHQFASTPRASQVLADVARRKPAHWIAIDDDVDDWPAKYLDHLVACDGRLGLSSPQAQDILRERLAKTIELKIRRGQHDT